MTTWWVLKNACQVTGDTPEEAAAEAVRRNLVDVAQTHVVVFRLVKKADAVEVRLTPATPTVTIVEES